MFFCSDELFPGLIKLSPSPIILTWFDLDFQKTVPNIDPLKLIELKIPKGPHIAELKIGKSITLADGRVIHPEDVVNEKQAVEWPNLLVADIESEAKLDSICNSTQLQVANLVILGV